MTSDPCFNPLPPRCALVGLLAIEAVAGGVDDGDTIPDVRVASHALETMETKILARAYSEWSIVFYFAWRTA